ncbi:MAG: DUF1684 domain-containing protein [Dehalococcoidia bacterium]
MSTGSASELDAFRARKDAFFASSPESPLLPAQRPGFTGLRYYPENPALVFDLNVEPSDAPEMVELQTSDGETATYFRWGRIAFTVEGQLAALTLFATPGGDELFLPFADAGRGTETYGAGRYVDVEPYPDGRIHLDFNYAYNPYCAYNDAWSCPIPPRENVLAVHIRAGERSFHDEA